ncbi:MAG: hypothetical protein ACOX08_11595 [Methanobacterium sp.]
MALNDFLKSEGIAFVVMSAEELKMRGKEGYIFVECAFRSGCVAQGPFQNIMIIGLTGSRHTMQNRRCIVTQLSRQWRRNTVPLGNRGLCEVIWKIARIKN